VPANIAKWAIDAYTEAGGKGLRHKKGKQDLPKGYYVVKVRSQALPQLTTLL